MNLHTLIHFCQLKRRQQKKLRTGRALLVWVRLKFKVHISLSYSNVYVSFSFCNWIKKTTSKKQQREQNKNFEMQFMNTHFLCVLQFICVRYSLLFSSHCIFLVFSFDGHGSNNSTSWIATTTTTISDKYVCWFFFLLCISI